MLREKITEAMHAQGLTAYALGKLAGVDPGSVSRFITGRSGMASGNLDLLLEALELRIVPEKRGKK